MPKGNKIDYRGGRKLNCIAIGIVCILWASTDVGCGKIEKADPPSANAINLHTRFELKPLIGIGEVRFGMGKEEIVKEFGEPDKIEGNGKSLMYLSKGFSFQVLPVRGLVFINCLTKQASGGIAVDFPGATDTGIAMGASETAIESAYGQPSKKEHEGPQVTLEYTGQSCDFILVNDKLVQIFMRIAPKSRESPKK